MHLEVSKRTDLALRALGYLQEHGHSSGHAIAESIDTTLNYLPQLLKPLVVHGWIVGTPGRGGGYQLTGPLQGVTVLDVIQAMEGVEEQRCVLRGVPCPAEEKCVLHYSWLRARDALLAELDATSVAATVASAPRKGE